MQIGKFDHTGRTYLVLSCFVLVIVGMTFFSRIFDPDFFWHLATGRWIGQNISLPEHDPFTPFFYGTARESLILQGYWLTQVVYHLFYSFMGLFGLAFLKCIAFVALFGIVLHYHHIKRSALPWVFLALVPMYETLIHFRADRPNMVSLLFFGLLLYLLETRRWTLLPLLMLFWANSHGGYLLGNVVILLYVGGLVLGRSKEVAPTVVGWALAAVGASFLNPLGLKPVLLMLKFEGGALQQATFEFMSPIRLALDFHDYYLGYFVALLLAVGSLFYLRKSSLWAQLAILVLTAYISLQHARYMPFLVITSAFYAPMIYSQVKLSAILRRTLVTCSVTLIFVLCVSDMFGGRSLTWGLEPGRFPQKAAEFFDRLNVTGRLFSHDVWGGYLIWALPDVTVLSDTRALSEEVYLNNLQIQQGNVGWEKELLALNPSILIVSAFNPITGRANNLWENLIYSENWQLAYADDVALVYLRNDVAKFYPRMSTQEKRITSLNHAMAQIQTFVEKYPQTPWHWGDLGHIHMLRGEIPEAVNALRKAQGLDPDNEDYRTRLQILEPR